MQKLMLAHIEKIDTAAWLRSLSQNQTTAIGQLQLALRDDLLQGTCYRVNENLEQIGIRPRVPAKKLKKFIILSRANNLAFLYFILEGYYKTSEKDEGYTNSEKLIMTAILILDILFTVRALDEILPPRSVKQTHTPPVEKCIKENNSRSILKSEERKKKSPYFQKFHRPKLQRSKKQKLAHQQEIEADFTFWNAGEKPNYEVEKEDRWFADYELQPAKRIVHKVLKNAINCLLTHIDLPLALLDGPSLCEHHQQWEEDKKAVQDALIEAANETCLKLIEERNADKKRRAAILKQLEDDINWYTGKYKRITQMQNTPVQMIGRTCADACDKCHKAMVHTQKKLSKNMHLLSLEKDIKRLQTATTATVKTISGPNRILKEIFLPNSNSDNSVNSWPKHASFSKRSALSVVDGCKLNNVDIKRGIRLSRKSKFFSSPTVDTPFKFDYRKIFPRNDGTTLGENFTIRRAFVKVLRKNHKSVVYESKTINASCTYDRAHSIDCTIKHIYSDEDSSDSSSDELDADKTNVYKAVIYCAEDICHQQMYQLVPENICRQLKAETESRNSRFTKKELVPLVYNDIDYFDPDNEVLMNRLLDDGINALKDDRRFVLASFPNANKLPVLREWIKRRFGKKYNYEELQKSIRESGEIFQACTKIHGQGAYVSLMGLPTEYVSYSSHDQMLKLGNEVKENYVGSLNEKLFEHMRYCWMGMGGHMVNQANATKLFYTYLPAKDSEIHRVRPWNGEFRDFKRFREDRQRREAAIKNGS